MPKHINEQVRALLNLHTRAVNLAETIEAAGGVRPRNTKLENLLARDLKNLGHAIQECEAAIVEGDHARD